MKKEHNNEMIDNNSGITEFQISLLSYDITNISEHLNKFKKDLHSKIGLLKKVNKRKKLLKYLKKNNETRYINIIKKLNIRK